MTLNKMLAFARWSGGCAIAMLGLGCAQIFGFDKSYGLGLDGGGAGAGGEDRGEGGAGGGGAGGAGAGGEGAGAGGEGAGTGGGGGGAGTGGGGGGAGGDGGGAGAGCVEEPPTGEPMDLSLIDDMEDGDGTIISLNDAENPRRGAWFVGNDDLGTQEPGKNETFFMTAIEPPRGSSLSAAYSEADDKFTDWGALFGFRLNSNETETNPGVYDASEFRGITFFARADSGSSTKVLVDVVDVQTWNKGGICTQCDDHFTKIVTLTPCWTQYKVAFSELKQSGWGQAFEAVDLTKVWGIQFRFGARSPFKLWIDDVAFYR
ncbi:hypothetical protein [Sorangium sp. So ce341]|uniref:hypothetical protein n=1 Tax=Sorangium sp. So ce341 TaxID=3133302 RepID=UPI003F5FFB15